MIACPYCKMDVEESYRDQRCPFCNEYVKSEEWLDRQSDSFVKYLRAKGLYDRLKIYVWNGEIDDATKEIRKTMGKIDSVIEPVIFSKILRDKPLDWEYTPAPSTKNEPVTRKTVTSASCSVCNHEISPKAETCPHCGQPTGTHVCPKCQSINTKVISGASKATSIFLWGPFAANKVVSKFECRQCSHKW